MSWSNSYDSSNFTSYHSDAIGVNSSKSFKWVPEKVLHLELGTCSGWAYTRGRECRWRIESYDIRHARQRLDELGKIHPLSKAVDDYLLDLAQHTLCAAWHRNPSHSQVEDTIQKWQRRIKKFCKENAISEPVYESTKAEARPAYHKTSAVSASARQQSSEQRIKPTVVEKKSTQIESVQISKPAPSSTIQAESLFLNSESVGTSEAGTITPPITPQTTPQNRRPIAKPKSRLPAAGLPSPLATPERDDSTPRQEEKKAFVTSDAGNTIFNFGANTSGFKAGQDDADIFWSKQSVTKPSSNTPPLYAKPLFGNILKDSFPETPKKLVREAIPIACGVSNTATFPSLLEKPKTDLVDERKEDNTIKDDKKDADVESKDVGSDSDQETEEEEGNEDDEEERQTKDSHDKVVSHVSTSSLSSKLTSDLRADTSPRSASPDTKDMSTSTERIIPEAEVSQSDSERELEPLISRAAPTEPPTTEPRMTEALELKVPVSTETIEQQPEQITGMTVSDQTQDDLDHGRRGKPRTSRREIGVECGCFTPMRFYIAVEKLETDYWSREETPQPTNWSSVMSSLKKNWPWGSDRPKETEKPSVRDEAS